MPEKSPSPRAVAAKQIEAYLENNTARFNAPYGILSSLVKFGHGKARSITFGVARYLDATICIIQPNRIEIDGQGALANKYIGTYHSVQEVLDVLAT